MPGQQKAVFVAEIGKPVILGTREVPTPNPGEVLVKVVSTLLLPHDAYARDSGLFVGEKLPAVLGANIAGIVENVGAAVTGFQQGDKVFGMANVLLPGSDQAGLQEYATLTATAIVKKPDTFSADQVVTVPMNLATSFEALFTSSYGFGWPAPWEHRADFDAAAETLVIIGAGSVAAKYGLQLAKLAGIGRIIAIAGPDNKAELERLGATHVVDRHGSMEDITEQVHAIAGKESVTHVYDCYSDTFELAASMLSSSKDSKLVTLHPDEQPQVLAEKRPRCSTKFVECTSSYLAPYEEAFWAHIPVWLKESKILPSAYRVVEGLDELNEINKALYDYAGGRGGPQLVVRP